MADSKITALASIGTGTDPANDPLVIVDVSDILPGGMSLTGTTKKVTLNNLLACSPTATLASATITGDLTVKTNVLKVDTTNNRVGIGTASPTAAFDILGAFGTSTAAAVLRNNSAFNNSNIVETQYFATNSNTGLDCIGKFGAINPAATGNNYGQFYWQIANAGSPTTAMTLNSTGLGVGVASPAQKLDVNGAVLATNVYLRSDDSDVSWGAGAGSRPIIRGNQTNNTIKFYTASTDRMTLDASGNLGIGVTPSAGKGCLQLSSGINFPATQVASSDANTLDDYEEGTFTPTVVGTTGAGTGTYTTQLGHYTKVGRIVTCDISLVWTAHTGTGNIDIGGLPFSVLNTTGYAASAVIGYIDNIALTAGNIPIAVLWWFNTTKIRLNQTPTGGGAASGVPMDSAGQINLSITYIVA